MKANTEYENELLEIFDDWQKVQKKPSRKYYDKWYNSNTTTVCREIYDKYISLKPQDRKGYIDHLKQLKWYCLDMYKSLHNVPRLGSKYFMAYGYLQYEIIKLQDEEDTKTLGNTGLHNCL